jgi:hypothetical protein
MVAPHPSAFIYHSRRQPIKTNASLGAGNKERPRVDKPVESLEIQIAAIQHLESAGLKLQIVQRADIGLLAVGNRYQGWDRSAQIQ